MAANSTMPVTDDPVINAESEVPVVLAVAITFTITSLTAVALRMYTRVTIVKRPGADDAAIVVAELFALLTAIGACMEARHGLGRHRWTLSDADFRMQQTWLYFVVIVYNIATNVIKLAFLLQYRRFLTGTWTMRICNAMAFVVIPVLTVVYVGTMATACFPLAAVVPSAAGHCLPQIPVWYFTGALNIATDFFIFLIPLPTIMKLRIPNKKQKALLLLIFSLGFFVCAISIIRILQYASRLKTADTSWTGVGTACWCLVEIHCAILCACLATLRPLFRRVFPWLAPRTTTTDASASKTAGAAASAPTRRRNTGGGAGAWESERRPSFDSAEGLKTGGMVLEMGVWAEGARAQSADVSAAGGGSEDEGERMGAVEAGKIYVRQTFEAREVREPV